ncbi:hypothetical protein [Nonomuraea sp. C10]|uniref:hypothetical protein n=1 Tax=Nonomuraea sp. C10 TaxID=2600577 RepID=UPI0011CE6831|nr:hypothetical protein [Nonomuraea sp. C10]TXK36034.1 hypothetical protein FR742_43585 [Nonomuraea sp. C10]
MKRITAALVLLLLAGCGQPAERPYQPREEPAPTTGAARAEPGATRPEPTPSQSAPTGARPATAEVGDLKVRIDWPAKDTALLRLFPEFYLAKYRAVISGDDGYLKHVDLGYRINAIRWVRDFTDDGRAVAGRSRLFRLKVNAVVGRGAEVDVCVDETEMRVVTADTGEPVKPQPTSIRAPYLQRMLARKDDDGVWRIKQIGYGTEGCRR